MSGWVDLSASTYLDDDHRQGVHVGFIRGFFFLLGLHDPIGIEKLGGTVTGRATVVGGRGIYRVYVPCDRTQTEVRKTGTAFRIDEDVRLGKTGRQSRGPRRTFTTYALQISMNYFVAV